MEIDQLIAEGNDFINEEIRVEKEEYETIYNEQTFENLEKMGFAISNFSIKKFQIAFFKKIGFCFIYGILLINMSQAIKLVFALLGKTISLCERVTGDNQKATFQTNR